MSSPPIGPDQRAVSGRLGLGARIRQLRQAAGLNLADASANAGISLSYLSDVERGRRLPTLEILDAVAASFGLTVVGLLSGVYPWDAVPRPRGNLSPPPDGRHASAGRRPRR